MELPDFLKDFLKDITSDPDVEVIVVEIKDGEARTVDTDTELAAESPKVTSNSDHSDDPNFSTGESNVLWALSLAEKFAEGRNPFEIIPSVNLSGIDLAAILARLANLPGFRDALDGLLTATDEG